MKKRFIIKVQILWLNNMLNLTLKVIIKNIRNIFILYYNKF